MVSKTTCVLSGLCLAPFLVLPLSADDVNTANCSTLNYTGGPYINLHINNETSEHLTGSHYWNNAMSGSCAYTGVQSTTYTSCTVHSTAASSSGGGESGITTPHAHTANSKDHGGLADGPAGGTATSDSEGAAAIDSCLIFPCGLPSISISGTGAGAGFTVSVSGAGRIIFDKALHYTNTCRAYRLTPYPVTSSCPNPIGSPTQVPQNGYTWVWDTNSCQWVQVWTGASPVVIDTKANRLRTEELFTDPAKGDYVSFDIEANGIIRKLSWPKSNSGVAWLVLDRDGDGVIKDGAELFGNFTPHADGGVPNHPNPNGFLALNWYDLPEQGGDGNLVIDKRDAVWQKLRLWLPGEHCYAEKDTACHSRPQELRTLESAGITSISGLWTGHYWKDAVGNEYKFETILNPLAETKLENEKGEPCCDNHQKSRENVTRTAYDVWLKAVQ